MRVCFLLLLLWSIAIESVAQNQYKIFKATEGITMKDEQGSEVAVSKRMEVTLGTVLHIPAGGKVGILETQSKQIYYSDVTGEVRVVSIVVDAKQQAQNSLSAINREILRSMTEQERRQKFSYAIDGATNRRINEAYKSDGSPQSPQKDNGSIAGAAHQGMATDSCTQRVYASLCSILSHPSQQESRLNLSLKKNDDAFHFLLENRSGKHLFVNILKIDKGGQKGRICLQPSGSVGTPYDMLRGAYLLLEAGGSRELSELPFAYEPDEEAQYLLFGSEQLFDSRLLQRLFEREAAPTAGECTLYTSSCIK